MTLWPAIGIILAFAAFCVAYRNLRLSHSCVVSIWDCKAGPSYSAGDGTRLRFEIFLQNIGLPLHNISMSLSFRSPGGFGTASYTLKAPNGDHHKGGQFAKGMITSFVIDPRFFEPHDKRP